MSSVSMCAPNEGSGTPIRRPDKASVTYRTSGVCSWLLVSPYVLTSCLLSYPPSYLPLYFLSFFTPLFVPFFVSWPCFLHRIPAFIFNLLLSFDVFLIIVVVVYLFISVIFNPIFLTFICLLVILLISLSLPLLLSFGTSFLVCIYFSHCLFALFAAFLRFCPLLLLRFCPMIFTPFFCLETFVFYSRCFFISLFLPCLIRITFSHSDLITEKVNGQKAWLCFNPKFSVG